MNHRNHQFKFKISTFYMFKEIILKYESKSRAQEIMLKNEEGMGKTNITATNS